MLREKLLTRLHSVLSAFQLVALAEQLRNMRKPTCSTDPLLHQKNSVSCKHPPGSMMAGTQMLQAEQHGGLPWQPCLLCHGSLCTLWSLTSPGIRL